MTCGTRNQISPATLAAIDWLRAQLDEFAWPARGGRAVPS